MKIKTLNLDSAVSANFPSSEFDLVAVKRGEKILSNEYSLQENQMFYDMYTSNASDINYTPEVGDKVKGKIELVSKNLLGLNIASRQYAYLNLDKENKDYLEYLTEGETVEVLITSIDKDGMYYASFTDLINEEKFNSIKDSIGDDTVAYEALVVEIIEQGGFWVEIDGIRAFMPGSLAGMNKLFNFESLLGTSLKVMPVNWSKEKKTIVVSHKKYLEALIPGELEKIDKDKKYTGFVTGSTAYGVFVQFNDCLTGMIYKSDLDKKTAEAFNNRAVKVGEPITFKVKEIITKKKIILTQQYDLYDPWIEIEKKYKEGQKVNGKVTNVKHFGAFIEIERGLTGLLPTDSQNKQLIASLSEGHIIDCYLSKIDRESRKIFFKK